MKATNGLSLLAHKCAPNVFDLSTGVVHASIRDQIVRAQLLMRDLHEKDKACKSVLIVGGGVSGISAAVMAYELGMEVWLVDSQKEPFSLQSSIKTRYVGPFMYEWPELGHDSQNYPPQNSLAATSNATPTWSAKDPISAAKLAVQLKNWLSSRTFPNGKARFFFGIDKKAIKRFVKHFVADLRDNPKGMHRKYRPSGGKYNDHAGMSFTATGSEALRPDYIVLAAGMGNERVALNRAVKGLPFWCNDNLKGVENNDSCVFGGGDGALQDILRLLTVHKHPLFFIDALNKNSQAKLMLEQEIPLLAALDRQSRLLATWADGSCHQFIDDQCRDIAIKLAKSVALQGVVFAQLRTGSSTVHHVFREKFFGKAYLLNRFVVHLIEQCLLMGRCTGKVTYVAHRCTDVGRATREKKTGSYLICLKGPKGNSRKFRFHWIAVRYGVDPDSAPQKQMITLTEQDLADRTSMAAIPLPTTVPK